MSLAFLFPGQGAQRVGMLGELAAAYPRVRERFEEAGDAIDQPLWTLLAEGPEDRLNSTAITQPVILAASCVIWELWRELDGPLPEFMAGHSLGEYSALVCAGGLDFAAGVKLVHRRGQLMQQAVPLGEGAMAAVMGLDDEILQSCCDAVDGVVTPANYHAPGQVVIAGATRAVEAAVAACEAAGARRAMVLPISVPCHCELLEPAREAFAAALDESGLRLPQIPVVHNVDGRIASDFEGLRSRLLDQLAGSVRWISCVRTLVENGVDEAVECGPGKVLAGLVKRIERGIKVHATEAPEQLRAALAELKDG